MTLENLTDRSFALTEFVAEILLSNGCSLDFGTAYGFDYLTVTSESLSAEKLYVVALQGREIKENLRPIFRFAEENPEQTIFLCVLNLKEKQLLQRVLLPNVKVHQLPLLDRYRFYRREFELRKRKI